MTTEQPVLGEQAGPRLTVLRLPQASVRNGAMPGWDSSARLFDPAVAVAATKAASLFMTGFIVAAGVLTAITAFGMLLGLAVVIVDVAAVHHWVGGLLPHMLNSSPKLT
jgi:hypothetical protein